MVINFRRNYRSLIGRLAAALALWGGLACANPAGAHADTYLYVLNMNPAPDGSPDVFLGSVSVVKTSPNGLNSTLIKTINVGQLPIQATASPDGCKVYVTNGVDNTVTEIRTQDNTVTGTFQVGNFPTGVVVSNDGSKLYVLNFGDNTVRVINASTKALIKTINVGQGPNLAALTPDGTRLYVTNLTTNDVSVINTQNNTVVASVPVGNGANGVAVTPDGQYVYVTNINDNTVSIIRTFNNHVIKTISSGGLNPNFVGFTLDGSTAYITNGGSDDTPDNKIGVINTSTKNLTGTITGGNGPAEVDQNPSGAVTYIPNFADNNVSVLKNSNKQIVTSFPVGTFPVGIAVVQK
jgi:YVTN family beta-propeller protein